MAPKNGNPDANILRAYKAYTQGRQTLQTISRRTGKSVRTLQRAFDRIVPKGSAGRVVPQPVALTFDATFFGRGYGVLVFRAQSKNIHWLHIETERLCDVQAGLVHLKTQGWQFSSITLDGRKGAIALCQRVFPDVPVQLCLFHQKAIVRRYLTAKPKSACAKELQALAAFLGHVDARVFLDVLNDLQVRYSAFLKERNEAGAFMHRRLRSALRSLRVNAPYLFTHLEHPERSIPTTTNSCDGSFAHWKAKVKIHRGLNHARRTKMINTLLADY